MADNDIAELDSLDGGQETFDSPAQDKSDYEYGEDDKDQKKQPKEEITEQNCKFTEGQMIRFVRVRFPGHAKSYPFLVGKRQVMYGQKVVAMSDRGMAVGYINSFVYQVPFSKSMLPIRTINKVATEHDFERERDTYKRQKEIETTCQNLIEKHKLEMYLTHVEFTQFGKKVVFYFVAPNRVDFRGLVKDLVTELKLRIELRQISLRDRAASMGALGPCGRELCCSSFLSRYGNVSIKMAKNQNLTLNYSKLNGVCGQLKCCLQYEEAVYDHKRKRLPEEGDMVETRNGDVGKVRKIHILTEQFDLITTKGQIRRYTSEQYKGRSDQKLPQEFDSILDETNNIIGLSELEAKQARQFEQDMKRIEEDSIRFADDTYTDLTGIDPTEQQKRTARAKETKPSFLEEEAFPVQSGQVYASEIMDDGDDEELEDDELGPELDQEQQEPVSAAPAKEQQRDGQRRHRPRNRRNRNRNHGHRGGQNKPKA